MERVARSHLTYITRTYYLLTKPGIIMGNAITTAAGFALASRGQINILLFLATVLGLSLVIASACVFNNYIDRDLDKKMTRTKNRPLVRGLISEKRALIFAVVLGVLGALVLDIYTNVLALSIALFGFFVYVVLYSFSKSRSIYGIAIGSIAGAVPPVVGYCAASNRLDLGALIFFAMLVMWQMPHFFAITVYRLKDYAAAEIPVLPIRKGMKITKFRMLLYILGFIASSCMLSLFNYTGYAFLVVATFLGLTWLVLCIQGFNCLNDARWARKMFLFSLAIIMSISFIIPFSVVA